MLLSEAYKELGYLQDISTQINTLLARREELENSSLKGINWSEERTAGGEQDTTAILTRAEQIIAIEKDIKQLDRLREPYVVRSLNLDDLRHARVLWRYYGLCYGLNKVARSFAYSIAHTKRLKSEAVKAYAEKYFSTLAKDDTTMLPKIG